MSLNLPVMISNKILGSFLPLSCIYFFNLLSVCKKKPCTVDSQEFPQQGSWTRCSLRSLPAPGSVAAAHTELCLGTSCQGSLCSQFWSYVQLLANHLCRQVSHADNTKYSPGSLLVSLPWNINVQCFITPIVCSGGSVTPVYLVTRKETAQSSPAE